MTIFELFNHEKISDDFIERKFDGSYWESCDKFVKDNWLKDLQDLSSKQETWLNKILGDCVEKRIKTGE